MASSSNTITMDCKKCGGQLKISPNAYILQCMYCGTQYLVRREFGNVFLDSYAACPLCNRNDKVKKLSAMANHNTPEHFFSPPSQPQYAPAEPGGCLQMIGAFCLAAVAIMIVAILFIGHASDDVIQPLIMFLAIGIGVFSLNAFLKKEYEGKKDRYLIPLLARWKQEYEEWRKLYYCERDDIVFIVGTKKYLPAEEYSRKRMELNNR